MATTISAGVLSGAFFSLGCGGGASLCGHVQHNFVIKMIQLNKIIFFFLLSKELLPHKVLASEPKSLGAS